MKTAILDDYQHATRGLADCSALGDCRVIDVFNRRLDGDNAADRWQSDQAIGVNNLHCHDEVASSTLSSCYNLNLERTSLLSPEEV